MGSAAKPRDRNAATASAMLRHPLRVRILEVANERDVSPVQFLREGLSPPGDYGLSHISHHFSELEKGGCLRVVKLIPRRGSVEHIYRGVARAFFSDDEWENRLSKADRRKVTKTVLQGLMARADGAILADTLDKRLDRHLSWLAMPLDEQGWTALTELQAETLCRAEEIRVEAGERLAATAGESFPVTFGALAFESPPSDPVAE
jgi:DNA-binding transcriptional ArsR family regulator